ncbi:sulfatase [Devosia rhodophyticola]|uniref:Sulfatase n=1 Tax=Devosia rhodophyticola TaxID=3026423 RepID=A0ABY7YXW1_9HYPH|nr:sulfatase [Devosia rhodophyticola]WDR06161.1 sulfatase [Devosia rhodophyticola]
MKKPNILFIMADDHAAKAISCYGHAINHTPNIDRIGERGMRLDHCYVSNSICTPSRASILTGTYNHVNGVTTLDTPFNNRAPHLAKHLKSAGYSTAIFGKWHLGEGAAHQPTGFDDWSVLPGQGEYFDPKMIGPEGVQREQGYVTDIITDKCLDWLEKRDAEKPFFLMCHHKAPHRNFAPHPKYRDMFEGHDFTAPESFSDDYSNRARAAAAATMRVRKDFTYADLGLAQPEGGSEVGAELFEDRYDRKIPDPDDVSTLRLVDANTGETFTFSDQEELHQFKFQRYMRRYLQTVASVDESVGRLLDHLEATGQIDNTIVIYTSDQGFFLGEHGWFDKRFIYEESLQMPFVVSYPPKIAAGSQCKDIVSNVDFAPTLLDLAGVPVPNYMQGNSFKPVLEGNTPLDWSQVAYHRYWMHRDSGHNIFAHYGIRSQRYKLIYWYNDDLGHPGAVSSDDPPEWELFDCKSDPLELCNVYDDPAYDQVKLEMHGLLDAKMAQIGDVPEH